MVQEEIRKADVTGVNRPVSWDGATKVHLAHHCFTSSPCRSAVSLPRVQ